MGRLMNIGYGNSVNTDKIIAIVNSDSAPAKRLVQLAKDRCKAIDGTQGRKTKAAIVTEGDHVVLSALSAETLALRFCPSKCDENSDDAAWKGENDE